MLSISPELQRQIENSAKYEGVAPEKWLETLVSQRAAFIANKRFWEAQQRSDIIDTFIENDTHYTDIDIEQELERRRILHLEQNNGTYKVEVYTDSESYIDPEELEELKEAIAESEEEERLGIHHTTEDMLAYVAKVIEEYKKQNQN